jgi:hypothetical protein
LFGEICTLQLGGGDGGGSAAAWITVARWPATAIVPVRSEFELGGTVKVIVPPPVPLVGLSEIQVASVDADQTQSLSVATVTIELPPLAPIV